MAVVALDDVWVVANFKETQVRAMRPGQRAAIEVDAYPGRGFEGHVEAIGAATTSSFSLLPPENASGNFVKVVQRLPVKIVLDQPRPNRGWARLRTSSGRFAPACRWWPRSTPGSERQRDPPARRAQPLGGCRRR